MMTRCGCREISRTPVEFKILECPQVHINSGPLLPNTNELDWCKLQSKVIYDFLKVIKQLECGILPDIEIILEEISLIFMNSCGYNVAKKMYATDLEEDYFLRHNNFLSEFSTLEEKDQVLLNLGIYDKLNNVLTKEDLNKKFGYVVRVGKMYYAFTSEETYNEWMSTGSIIPSDLILGEWVANDYVPNEYTISFNSTGGSLINNYKITEGASFELPTPLWTDNSMTFDGWYNNSQYSGLKYTGRIVPTGNMVFYAKWILSVPNILTMYSFSSALTSNYTSSSTTTKLLKGEDVNISTRLKYHYIPVNSKITITKLEFTENGIETIVIGVYDSNDKVYKIEDSLLQDENIQFN